MKVLNDLLWDGDLKIYQDSEGFKFSLDSILLSKFVTINERAKKILDIGTGNAPIPLMLSKRTKAKIVGIEIQEKSYMLAKESVLYNNLENQIDIKLGDIKDFNFENNYYDVIVCNPPYYKNDMIISKNDNKKIARSEENLDLNNLFRIARKMLKNKGIIAIVIDSKRLGEVFNIAKENNFEIKKLQFVYPKIDRKSNIVLIEGKMNGNPGLSVLEPIIVQDENNNYTKYIENLLKNFEN